MRTLACLPLFLLCLAFTACFQTESVSRCPEAECGPFEFRTAFYPMAEGNSWTFIDSLFTDTGVVVSSVSQKMSFVEIDAEGVAWWQFDHAPQPFSGVFTQRNDTVFQKIGTRSGQLVFSPRFFPPMGPDSSIASVAIDDDAPMRMAAIPLPGIYSTPAGNFRSCAFFSLFPGHNVYFRVETVVCAGVGAVRQNLYGWSESKGAYLTRTLQLTSYSLER